MCSVVDTCVGGHGSREEMRTLREVTYQTTLECSSGGWNGRERRRLWAARRTKLIPKTQIGTQTHEKHKRLALGVHVQAYNQCERPYPSDNPLTKNQKGPFRRYVSQLA